MSSMVCGKCQSESTYYEGGGLACMKCGNRSPSRWGFHRKGEEIKAPDPIDEPRELEDEEIEEEEMNMGKKRTPEQRERIAAGIRAALDRKKAAAGGGQSNVEKKPKDPKPATPAADPKPDRIKKILEADAKVKDPPFVRSDDFHMALAPKDPRIVIMDFTYEPWVAYGRRSRRGPGDQAMQLIEDTLKASNAL